MHTCCYCCCLGNLPQPPTTGYFFLNDNSKCFPLFTVLFSFDMMLLYVHGFLYTVKYRYVCVSHNLNVTDSSPPARQFFFFQLSNHDFRPQKPLIRELAGVSGVLLYKRQANRYFHYIIIYKFRWIETETESPHEGQVHENNVGTLFQKCRQLRHRGR